MPIFEYICNQCKQPFEALVMGSRQPECPRCHGRDLAQQISVFSVGGPRTHTSNGAAPGCGPAAST
jgi:putative FmdB family regulatory protein